MQEPVYLVSQGAGPPALPSSTGSSIEMLQACMCHCTLACRLTTMSPPAPKKHAWGFYAVQWPDGVQKYHYSNAV